MQKCTGFFSLVLKIKKMKKTKLQRNKKAFIASLIADFWSYLLFVVIIIVFAILFRLQDASKEDQLTGVQSITDGNYLAQTYLRMPLTAKGLPDDFTVGDFIIYYDHNVTEEKKRRGEILQFIWDGLSFISGIKDSNYYTLDKITKEYIKNNFDDNTCYLFGIIGNDFEYTRTGDYCKTSFSIVGSMLFDYYSGIPTETYATHLPPMNPNQKLITVVVISDLSRLLRQYGGESYGGLDEAAKTTQLLMCISNPLTPGCAGLQKEIAAMKQLDE